MPEVVIVPPVENEIPEPAVIEVMVPEPPPAPAATQDIVPEVSDAKTDVPDPGYVVGHVYVVFAAGFPA